MKISRVLLSIILIAGLQGLAWASGENAVKTVKSNIPSELESAAASGVSSILVITGKNANYVDKAVELAQETAALQENVMVALVDRDNEENKAITEKYNLTRYPAPFLLIVAPAGNVTGGATPGRITAEQLVKYIPSPCYNQALKARNEHKSTLVFVTAKDDENLGDWEGTIAATQGQIDPKPEIIRADVNDAGEASFLSRVGYRGEPTPMLIVVNASGQVTGKFTSNPDAGMVKLAVEKVISKGCGGCPSSSSCSGKDKAGCEEK